MSSLPASAELAAKAGLGPEGHKRTASVESGACTDTTLVGAGEPGLDGGAKPAGVDHAQPTPAPRVPKRAASVSDLAAQAAKRGRVTAEMAAGAPVGNSTTNDASGSPTAAAPKTISTVTTAALAAADNHTDEPVKPVEASKTDGNKKAHPAPRDEAATAVVGAGADAEMLSGSRTVHVPSDPSHPNVVMRVIYVPKHLNPAARPRKPVFPAPPRRSPDMPAPYLPPSHSEPARLALAALTGGGQAGAGAIDWAAVAACGPVPPASQTALGHLGALPPLSPMQAGYIQLANMVKLAGPERRRVNVPAAMHMQDQANEIRLQEQAAEIRATVVGLIAGTSKQASGTDSTSPGPSAEEIEAAVHEADLDDLELYKDDEREDSWSDDEDSFNPDWLK